MTIINESLTVLAVLVLITLYGCVSVNSTRLSTAPDNLSPIPADMVKVYNNENSVTCDYSEVAIINTQGSESIIGNNKLVAKAKEEAGSIGANAVIISKFGESAQLLSSQPTAEVLAIYENDCQD